MEGQSGWPVWALATGQTLGYACLFYIFAALIFSWEAALGWDKAVFAAGPMLAVAVSALLAPVAGRLVDRGFGPELLTGGALGGGLALGALALVQSPAQYIVVWAVIGVAQAACLYEVCFAFLIRRYGLAARPAIIRVTLVAGLASTLAFPSGASLASAFGWRVAVLVAAAAALGVMAPLHFLAARHIRRTAPPPEPGRAQADRDAPVRALRSGAFWLLAGLFSLVGLNHWMLIHFLVPLLTALGVALPLAVFAASCIGPAQVLGRLALMRYEARIGTGRATGFTLGALAAASVLLIGAGLSPVLVLGFATLQGAALGVMTILRPMLVAEALGRAGFGTINGLLSIPSLAASALAPMLGALLFDSTGPAGMIAAALAFALAGGGLVALLARHRVAEGGG